MSEIARTFLAAFSVGLILFGIRAGFADPAKLTFVLAGAALLVILVVAGRRKHTDKSTCDQKARDGQPADKGRGSDD